MTLWRPGMRITDTRLNGGPGVFESASAFTVGTGWALVSAYSRKCGNIITTVIALTRTGAQLDATKINGAGPTDAGNLADTTLGTMAAGWYDPNSTVIGTATTGLGAGACRLMSTGAVSLVSWLPNASILVNAAMQVSFTVVLADPDGSLTAPASASSAAMAAA